MEVSGKTEKRIPAIPTRYGGIQFRSRLEARWAAFFDICGWRWAYEPIDLSNWIPDFVLHLHQPVLVEVKPALTETQLRAYCEKIDKAEPPHEVLLVGADVGLVEDKLNNSVSLGLLRERIDQEWYCENGPIRRGICPAWGAATVYDCSCGLTFAHDEMSYACRVCNGSAAHRLGSDYSWSMRVMRMAADKTQWRRP